MPTSLGPTNLEQRILDELKEIRDLLGRFEVHVQRTDLHGVRPCLELQEVRGTVKRVTWALMGGLIGLVFTLVGVIWRVVTTAP